jgi:hypothetical protein
VQVSFTFNTLCVLTGSFVRKLEVTLLPTQNFNNLNEEAIRRFDNKFVVLIVQQQSSLYISVM